MFDQETIQLLSALPAVRELSGESARARLTQAYLEIVRLRVSAGIASIAELPQSLDEVRQMANSLELFCLIQFAREGQLQESGRAAAFVAAQSLELLGELAQAERPISRHILANPQTMSLVESGLLYLIAGYYANAATIRRKLSPVSAPIQTPASYTDLRQNVANNVLSLLGGLIGLDVNVAEQYSPVWPTIANAFTKAPSDLSASAEGQLLSQIGLATAEYLDYLAGQRNTPEAAITRIADLMARFTQVMQPDSLIQPPAESFLPYHLASLLEIVFRDLTSFATAHNVPPPTDADTAYHTAAQQWLRAKARRKHALLWHSTKTWLEAKHSENAVHTVVSMPTGSGKSFLAELALVERLHKGWGLYLAPMNALVRQIQQDLEREMPEIGVNIRRFLTDEHTTLEDEIFTGAAAKEIVIMTPEKALLAIRLRPEAFNTCAVCIFDECHILAKENRGAASDDFLSRLIVHAPDVHIMLMSAMVQNPEKLADWLHKTTGKISRPISLNWKPTRNLRTLATVPQEQIEGISDKQSHLCVVQLVGQASIAWQQNGDSLFVNSPLPDIVKVKREGTTLRWDNSINAAARQIGAALARQHIPTLVFLNTNATHVWAQGRETPQLNWQIDEAAIARQEKVNAWLQLARAELGSLSPLGQLHQKGVTVHSGALIDEERRAAEMAYKHGLVGLMIATGTLAQGLNFPSQAVVMAGIEGSEFVGERTAADILNALGRSGRAGFYNIGLSILVPKRVLQYVDRSSVDDRTAEYQLLRQQDACLDVNSALKEKVDSLIAAANSLDLETGKVHPNDLETATLILGINGDSSQELFFKYSYAAHSADDSADYATEGINAAQKLVNFFLKSSPCPAWLPELAQRAGLSIAWLSQLHQAIEQTISLEQALIPQAGFADALLMLREVIKRVHPVVMVDKFGGKPGTTGITELQGLPKSLRGQEMNWSVNANDPVFAPETWQSQWDEVFGLLNSWLIGDSFKLIAATFFGLELPEPLPLLPDDLHQPAFPRSDRRPLHQAIKSVKGISYPLRHISGGLVQLLTKMMLEANLIESEEAIPLSIGMLPQAIHWGVDRLDKAFWYYNLLPVRCVAHACAEAFPTEYEDDAQIKVAVIEQAAAIHANPDNLLAYTGISGATKNVLSATTIVLK